MVAMCEMKTPRFGSQKHYIRALREMQTQGTDRLLLYISKHKAARLEGNNLARPDRKSNTNRIIALYIL